MAVGVGRDTVRSGPSYYFHEINSQFNEINKIVRAFYLDTPKRKNFKKKLKTRNDTTQSVLVGNLRTNTNLHSYIHVQFRNTMYNTNSSTNMNYFI